MLQTRVFHPKRPLSALFILCLSILFSGNALAQSSSVEVEEIEVTPAGSESAASTLWKETKQKTGEAASSAANFSEVQGSKALEATKTGAAKGADAVAKGSVKAWEATKSATKSAAEYTGEKASQAGAIIAGAVKGSDKKPPVVDKSIAE